MGANHGSRLVATAIFGFAVGISWQCARANKAVRDECCHKTQHEISSEVETEPVVFPSAPKGALTNTAEDAIEPFSAEVLKRRVLEVFPAGYLTLVAIIQGVALGTAIVAAQQQLTSQSDAIGRYTTAMQASAVFVAIVVITHRYFILTVNARWTPTIFDTLIPYALGVGEITTALVVGHNTAWWAAVSVLFLAAVGAFGHTYIREFRTPSYDQIRKPIMVRMIY